MSVAKNKLEDGKYRPGIDDDYDDFDLRSNRGRSQKDGILELLLRSEQSYQQATRRGLKERIEALTVKHREEHASIVAYIDAMQRFDVIFTDIRRKEGVENIGEILATIDIYEDKFREKSKDLAFLEDAIIHVQHDVLEGREQLFTRLNLASNQIVLEREDEYRSRMKEILEERAFE